MTFLGDTSHIHCMSKIIAPLVLEDWQSSTAKPSSTNKSAFARNWISASSFVFPQPSGQVYRRGHSPANASKDIAFFHHRIAAFWTIHAVSFDHATTKKRPSSSCPVHICSMQLLLCGHLFRFALLAQQFQCTLCRGVLGGDFFLHLGGRLFQFRSQTDIAVVLHACSSRDQAAHDHVLLESAQVVHCSLDGSFCEHARGLLERCRGDERLG